MSSALYLATNWRIHDDAIATPYDLYINSYSEILSRDSFQRCVHRDPSCETSYHVRCQSRRWWSAAIRRTIGKFRLMDRRRNWFHLGPTHPLSLDSTGSSRILRLSSSAQRRTVHGLNFINEFRFSFEFYTLLEKSMIWKITRNILINLKINPFLFNS